jgi:HSP20 family protein
MPAIQWSRDLDPVGALMRLQEELGRTFFRPVGWDLGLSGRGVHPPVNVFQNELGEYVIHVEVPGYKPSELSLESRGQTLTISGKREEKEPAAGSFHRRERRGGEFSRSLQLPRELDPSRAEASSTNGILSIRVPLREEARPRRIDVRAS